MSKNITIQEGGIGRSFTAQKLKTLLPSGEHSLWVPKKERLVTTKNISEVGIYSAAADGYFGYTDVDIDVRIGLNTDVTGKGQDGNEYNYHTDRTDGKGQITVMKVPSKIKVIQPPYNPYVIYVDGQTISKDGMIVEAYDENNLSMGRVPIEEVLLKPTIAEYDEESSTYAYDEMTSEITSMTINCASEMRYLNNLGTENIMRFTKGEGVVACGTPSSRFIMYASRDPYAEFGFPFSPRTLDSIYSYNGLDVHYSSMINSSYKESISPPPTLYISSTGPIAWTMVYGNPNHIDAGSKQTITVEWPRTGDKKVLKTTFDIRVGPSPSGDDDN